MFWDVSAYLSLFAAAFGAATLLPLQSEALLSALLLSTKQPASLLLIAASLGNILGSVANWLLGRYLANFQDRAWFPVKEKHLEKAQQAYQRYGYWSLLLSWVPIIGDPLTLIAGTLREPLWRFLVIVSLAKTARYFVVAAVTLGLLN